MPPFSHIILFTLGIFKNIIFDISGVMWVATTNLGPISSVVLIGYKYFISIFVFSFNFEIIRNKFLLRRGKSFYIVFFRCWAFEAYSTSPLVRTGTLDDKERELFLRVLPGHDSEDEEPPWRCEPRGWCNKFQDVRSLWSGHGNHLNQVKKVLLGATLVFLCWDSNHIDKIEYFFLTKYVSNLGGLIFQRRGSKILGRRVEMTHL